jgi:hypothetical protein
VTFLEAARWRYEFLMVQLRAPAPTWLVDIYNQRLGYGPYSSL